MRYGRNFSAAFVLAAILFPPFSIGAENTPRVSDRLVKVVKREITAEVVIEEIRIVGYEPRDKASRPDGGAKPPKNERLGIQSCVTDGNRLLIGDYGVLADVNLGSGTAVIIEEDDGMALNRAVMLQERGRLWVVYNEGGMGGASLASHTHRSSRAYSFPGLEAIPDAMLRYRNHLVMSTPAGLLQLNERDGNFLRYVLYRRERANAVFDVASIDRHLWVLREDGFVRMDLARRLATHYSLRVSSGAAKIFGLALFENHWWIGSDEALFRVPQSALSLPVPG